MPVGKKGIMQKCNEIIGSFDDVKKELGVFSFWNPSTHPYSLWVTIHEIDNRSKMMKMDKDNAALLIDFLKRNFEIE